jgi:hypothetical protein
MVEEALEKARGEAPVGENVGQAPGDAGKL